MKSISRQRAEGFLSYTPPSSFFPLFRFYLISISTPLTSATGYFCWEPGFLAAILYLKTTLFLGEIKRREELDSTFVAAIRRVPLRKKSLLLFALAAFLYCAGGTSLVLQDVYFSGDEPHYLIISHSLLKDGDFEINNNYRNRDYLLYMPRETKLTAHKRSGSKYSFHQPGLSIVAMPVYALALLFKGGNRRSSSVFLWAFISALLSLQIFLIFRQNGNNDRLALKMWALYCFTSPVFFYGFHFYTEPFIALFSLYIFRRIQFGRFFHVPQLLRLGTVVGVFIWFNDVKYLLIAVPLVLYAVWILRRKHGLRSRIFSFLLPFLLLAGLYYVLQYALRGSLSPIAIQTTGGLKSGGFFSFLLSTITTSPFVSGWKPWPDSFWIKRTVSCFILPSTFSASAAPSKCSGGRERICMPSCSSSLPYPRHCLSHGTNRIRTAGPAGPVRCLGFRHHDGIFSCP